MSEKPKLFKVNSSAGKSEDMVEVDFTELGIQVRRDIQEWIAANPGILGGEFLIIAKEFSEFGQIRERLDLLAVARDGQIVVIELKRDDTGDDAHWQAIKYASYFHGVGTKDIVEMFAAYGNHTIEEARQELIEYTDSYDDLDRLNENQRIVLVSHRFAPQVTSAALWLNEQAKRNLVTCVQLTPYKDPESGSLYLLANAIIPVPGAESYFIGIRDRTGEGGPTQKSPNLNRSDTVTQFCEDLATQVLNELPDRLRPNRTSRWAGGYQNWRYFHLWYSGPNKQKIAPWGNWDMFYNIEVIPKVVDDSDKWCISVGVGFKSVPEELRSRIQELQIVENVERTDEHMWVWDSSESLDSSFRSRLAQILKRFIEVVTPSVREFVDQGNEEDS